MKYETPNAQVVEFEVKEAVANNNEIEEDFGGLISKNSQPQ